MVVTVAPAVADVFHLWEHLGPSLSLCGEEPMDETCVEDPRPEQHKQSSTAGHAFRSL